MKDLIKKILFLESQRLEEKDDRCTRIAKRKYDVWPSAYASGAVVKCRQGKIWKNESLEYDLNALTENTEYEDSIKKDIPSIGDFYKNVTVKTQDGSTKRDVKVVYVYPEESKALVRTDAGGEAVVKFDDLISELKVFDEKWSKKYKKSIDCSNPKGFSQKAHCDARKKRQKGEETKSKSPFSEAKKTDFSKEKEQGLHGWFARQGGKGKSQGWVDCNTCRKDPETGRKKCKPCGRQEGEERSKYPACRPTPSACGSSGKGKSWGKKSKNESISEGLQYHLENRIPLSENIYRHGSKGYYELINEVRELYLNDEINLSHEDEELINTNIGTLGLYEGKEVWLDIPFEEEIDTTLNEAEYAGRKVELGKPRRNTVGGKKYVVYVKNPSTGRVKKISFGDVKGGLTAKVSNPKARKAFASRHNCKEKKDRMKAGYWACRLNRFGHLWGGKTYPGYW